MRHIAALVDERHRGPHSQPPSVMTQPGRGNEGGSHVTMPDGPGNRRTHEAHIRAGPQAPPPGGYPPRPPPAPAAIRRPVPGSYPPPGPVNTRARRPRTRPFRRPRAGSTGRAATAQQADAPGVIAIVVLVVILVGVGGCFSFFRDRFSGDVTARCRRLLRRAGGALPRSVTFSISRARRPHDAEVFVLMHPRHNGLVPRRRRFRHLGRCPVPRRRPPTWARTSTSRGGLSTADTSIRPVDSWGSGDRRLHVLRQTGRDGAKLYETVKGLGRHRCQRPLSAPRLHAAPAASAVGAILDLSDGNRRRGPHRAADRASATACARRSTTPSSPPRRASRRTRSARSSTTRA